MATSLPESFQLIFHDSLLGVAVILGSHAPDLENSLLLYANPALLKLLREWHPDRHDLINLISDLSTNLDGQTLLPFATDIGSSQSLITELRTSEDMPRWLEIRTQPTVILGEKGHFFWVNDITSTKEKELVARREAALADAAAQAKSNFLATMSHEIRTPLQTIFGMLELLNEDHPSPKQAFMINAAKLSANNLLGILDDILDLAKVEAGKMELDSFELPLRTLVNGVIESLEAKRRESSVFLVADIADNVPAIIKGDPKRLRQILTNLVGNALKFTESGGITLKVSLETRHITFNEGDIGLRIEVNDTGIGMTHEVASKLFQPFVQADNTTTRRFGGTGLGLSIAYRFVELMDGKIGVNSTPGKGSQFWLEIPTQIASDTADTSLPDLTGLTILSIEDHPRAAQEIEHSLQSMGANVTLAGTVAEGTELATKRPFDVAIVDHGLPDGTGLELLRELNRLRPFMGCILYTVHEDYNISQQAKFLGAKYLSKPASRRGLGEAVKRATKQTRQMSQNDPGKLLIAEDNANVRDVLQRQFEIIGIEADFATDGQEAWDILQEKRHGILITDLHMPRMDGYNLVSRIRQHESADPEQGHLPVIAMTADVQLVHEQSYLKHGFDECLLKPVSLGQIRQLLVRWHLQDEKMNEPAPLSEDVAIAAPVASPPASSSAMPASPVINEELAISQFGAFDETALEMIGMFAEMSTNQIREMHEAYDSRNWQRLGYLSHSLKGAAYSACCSQLGDVATLIQDYTTKGAVPEAVFSLLQPAFDAIPLRLAELKR